MWNLCRSNWIKQIHFTAVMTQSFISLVAHKKREIRCIVKTSRSLPSTYFHNPRLWAITKTFITYHLSNTISCCVVTSIITSSQGLSVFNPSEQLSFQADWNAAVWLLWGPGLEKVVQSNCQHTHFCPRMHTSLGSFVIIFDIQDACKG